MEGWTIGVLITVIGMVLFGVAIAWEIACNEKELREAKERMRKACDEVQAERRAHLREAQQAEAEAREAYFQHVKAKHGYTDEETQRLLNLQHYAARHGYPVPRKL